LALCSRICNNCVKIRSSGCFLKCPFRFLTVWQTFKCHQFPLRFSSHSVAFVIGMLLHATSTPMILLYCMHPRLIPNQHAFNALRCLVTTTCHCHAHVHSSLSAPPPPNGMPPSPSIHRSSLMLNIAHPIRNGRVCVHNEWDGRRRKWK